MAFKDKTKRTEQCNIRIKVVNREWIESEMADMNYEFKAEFIDDLITTLREAEISMADLEELINESDEEE